MSSIEARLPSSPTTRWNSSRSDDRNQGSPALGDGDSRYLLTQFNLHTSQISSLLRASKFESSSLMTAATQNLTHIVPDCIRSPKRSPSDDSPTRHSRQLKARVDGSPSRSARDFAKRRSDCDFSSSVMTTL
ncbi:hypothetical protein TIFTF001_037138 [Ficus carica]|uniref:Uncharacterized protein n=1 Tax=Ficus carica TaxID=3494 RepID=A0AA88EG02_FICCA|nr:hypothetical protein TIFTF001_037138 [Ficus carica]